MWSSMTNPDGPKANGGSGGPARGLRFWPLVYTEFSRVESG
jgi:hypothetical protein